MRPYHESAIRPMPWESYLDSSAPRMVRLPTGSPPAPRESGLLRVLKLVDLAALAAISAPWDLLAARSPQGLPHLSHAWVSSWIETIGEGRPFTVHAAFAGDALVGVLPVVETSGGGLRSRRPIVGPPRDDHTRSGDALVEPAIAPMAMRALLESVEAHEPPFFALTLRGVRDRSPTVAALVDGPAFGVLLETTDERGSYVPVDGDLAAFRARLSDNFRRNVRKAGNRLAKAPGTNYRMDFGPAADSAGLDAFLTVEASGWKGRAGTAISQSPALIRFYRTLIPRLARLGWLEWHHLEIDGRPAAVHFATRLGRSLVLLKIAYDESFARLGPGNLLFDHVVEREFAARTVDEINCMTDMAWHRNWELPRSVYTDFTIYPSRPGPLLAGALPARMKAALKRVPWLQALVDRRAHARAPGDGA